MHILEVNLWPSRPGLLSWKGQPKTPQVWQAWDKTHMSGSWSEMKFLLWEESFTSHFYLHFHHSKKIALFVVLLFYFSLTIWRTFYFMMFSLGTDLVQLKYTSASEKPKITMNLTRHFTQTLRDFFLFFAFLCFLPRSLKTDKLENCHILISTTSL